MLTSYFNDYNHQHIQIINLIQLPTTIEKDPKLKDQILDEKVEEEQVSQDKF